MTLRYALRCLQTVQVVQVVGALGRAPVLVRFVLRWHGLHVQIRHDLRARRVLLSRGHLRQLPTLVLHYHRALVVGQQGRRILQNFPPVVIPLEAPGQPALARQRLVRLSHHLGALHLDVVHVRRLRLIRRVTEQANVRLHLGQGAVRRADHRRWFLVEAGYGKRGLGGSRVRWRRWVIDFAGHARGSRHLEEGRAKKKRGVNKTSSRRFSRGEAKRKETRLLSRLIIPVEPEAQWPRNRRPFVERPRDPWPRPACATSRPRPGGAPSSPDSPSPVAVAPSRPAPSPPSPAPPAPVAAAARR